MEIKINQFDAALIARFTPSVVFVQADSSFDPAVRQARRSREERIWQDPVARGAESGQIRSVHCKKRLLFSARESLIDDIPAGDGENR